MLGSLDAENARYLNHLNAIERRMSRAQAQITSGKRLNTVSDNPDQISALLSARANLESTKQINYNMNRVRTEVDGAEKSLQEASKTLERVRVLGAQGANSTQTASTRETLAEEVGALLEHLVGISRTAIEGRHLFSGDLDQNAPYTVDLTQNPPVSAYLGSTNNTRQVQHPNGTRFFVSRTAQEIFDSSTAADNVFAAVSELRAGLLANDQVAIDAAMDRTVTAASHLERQLAYYGTVQNRVAEAVDYGKKLEFTATQQISAIEDTDLTEAILELTQAQTAQKAALQAKASVPRTSLFDYLR